MQLEEFYSHIASIKTKYSMDEILSNHPIPILIFLLSFGLIKQLGVIIKQLGVI
ncbi:hypothetical protein [Clostridium botulinum]|uniref:hypothetical protein n=1 Tax=Clostridium botulinum TaxID=1491 RepID=UPI001FA7FDD5|nr:hypothetical protein [Clostridium botulinum]MCC5427036.1 hypothetical protein [Clostridium botulinum]